MKLLINTLCFIFDDNRVLLAMKKRGFGVGRWNGYGGKVEDGETIEQAAIREIKEETTIDARKIEERGVINFIWESGKHGPIECHIFKIVDYAGEPQETEEMKPQWFSQNDIPFESMWSDDPLWLPELLADKTFKASFIFDDTDQVVRHNIELK